MTTLVSLLDDHAVGGVTHKLRDLHEALEHEGIVCSALGVDPRRPGAPALAEADVIHVNFTVSWRKMPFLLALRLRNPRARLIIEEHTYTAWFETLKVPDRRRFRLMARLSYALADAVIAVSEAQGAWLRAAALAPEHKIRVIQGCRNLSAFAAVPPIEDRSGPLVVAAYGRFHEQKGFETLIKAMGLLPRGHARLILGGMGEEEERLRVLAKDMPNVTFAGPVTDVPSFLAQADIVAIPSRWEAFGLVCAEARAAGRPCLTSDRDGLPEQLVLGGGRVIPAEDYRAWAERLSHLTRAEVIGMGADARGSGEGAWDRHASAWAALLRDCSVRKAERKAMPMTTSAGQIR